MTTIDESGARCPSARAKALLAFICVVAVHSQADAQAPRPDPALEVTADMRARLASECKGGVRSIEAHYRSVTEYAYVYCASLGDDRGRQIAPVVYCERNASQSSWSCREYNTDVRATVAGRPVAFSFEHATLDQSIEVLSFILASPQLAIVPKQWTPERLSSYEGRFLVSGPAGVDRYSFEVRQVARADAKFEVVQISRCQIDTCHPIWSAGEGDGQK